MAFPYWFTHYVAPLLKPEVDAYTALLKADEPEIVAYVTAEVGNGGNYAEATVAAFINKLPSSFFFNLFKPQIISGITAVITALVGKVDGNAQAWFDAAYAEVVKVEGEAGL